MVSMQWQIQGWPAPPLDLFYNKMLEMAILETDPRRKLAPSVLVVPPFESPGYDYAMVILDRGGGGGQSRQKLF